MTKRQIVMMATLATIIIVGILIQATWGNGPLLSYCVGIAIGYAFS